MTPLYQETEVPCLEGSSDVAHAAIEHPIALISKRCDKSQVSSRGEVLWVGVLSKSKSVS